MNLQSSNPTFRYLLSISVVSITYFIVGTLGLQLAVQPGFATAIWPPSGIALAATLIIGYRACPSVFLGSLLVNLWKLSGGSQGISLFDFGISFGIGIGANARRYVCL